jgi:hypothetical protein
MKISTLVFSLGLTAAMPVAAGAQTATDLNNQVTTMNNTTANEGQSHVIGKISSDFGSFLGDDATAVVTGLRYGTPITFSSTATNGIPVTTSTVITPPTGQMGFGEVYISLALAKQQLGMLGITEPTPEQLQAALTGGTIEYTGATGATTTTELQGILNMRSEGMGWGKIAQEHGFKLGSVMSAMKSGNKSLAVSSAAASKGSVNANATRNSGSSSEKGVVSAGGKAQGNSGVAASSGNKGGNSGIVSASGRASGNAYGIGNSGIVTGAGRPAGAGGGVVSAGGGNQGVGRGKAPGK